MRLIRRNNPGFTLIELLIVTAILSVISLAVYATFNNGLKIWQKVNTPSADQDIVIFFDKFTGDLRNCLKFKGISFAGDSSSLEIPTLVNSANLGKKTIGRVAYVYDQQAKALSRKQNDYSQLYGREEGVSQGVLKNLSSLKFEYYFYDKFLQS